MNRFEVHSHTHFSNLRLLDCINKPKDLIDRARKIGLKGIAITDHEALCSHIEVNMYAQEIAKEDPEFKVALGNEIYLVDERTKGQKYYHFILIAKDAIGHKQLRRLSSLAWLNSYNDRGERVPTLKEDLYKEVKKNPGHLIATTACLGGELSTNIKEMENSRAIGDMQTAAEAKSNIINFVLWCKDLFGEDFYFEVAPAANQDQILVNKKMVELSTSFNIPIVIGTDAHYLKREDRFVHKAYLNSADAEREVDSFYEYSYLQDEDEIKKNLESSIVDMYEVMCENSMSIYNKIENYSLLHPQQIPKVEVINYPKMSGTKEMTSKYPILSHMLQSDDGIERYWINECLNKLQSLNKLNDIYLERLEYEADIKYEIGKKLQTNMFEYPVTLQHYVDLFWECGSTVGAGRGSSCSGLNHYLLGVTQLDPIEWELPFWRLEL